jgi:ferredoxin-type protein NapF
MLGRLPAGPTAAAPRTARISLRCMAMRGILCRACDEHCEPRAVRFELLPAGRSVPSINDDLCNGCGECARVCPAQAIALEPREEAHS